MVTSICKDLEKREPCCALTGNVTWYSHNVEQYGGFSKNAKREHNLVIPLMGPYHNEMDYYLNRTSILYPHVQRSIFHNHQPQPHFSQQPPQSNLHVH